MFLEYYTTVSKYPTTEQKNELLRRVNELQPDYPHYTRGQLDTWLSRHRKLEKQQTGEGEFTTEAGPIRTKNNKPSKFTVAL